MQYILTAVLAYIFFCSLKVGFKKLNDEKISIRNTITIIIFCFIIFMPGIVKFLNPTVSNASNIEKRELKDKPKLIFTNKEWSTFPKQYESYYNDNFGLRDKIIYYNSMLKYKILKTSPVEKVLMGKEGWFFYASKKDGDPIGCYLGNNLFSEEELEKIKKNLQEQKRWLDKQGITFILVIAPNKHSIYGEYLPDKIKKKSNSTRLDQLINYLKNSEIEIVDLRESLIAEKNNKRLYHKTDTHWNQYGAYIGYVEIMRTISKYFTELHPKDISEYEVQVQYGDGGDLSNMMALKSIIKEEYINLIPKFKKLSHIIEREGVNGRATIISEVNNAHLPKLVVFRDSFSIDLIPLLSEHFSRSIYIWSHKFDSKTIESEKPDLVIHEIVERYIEQLLGENPDDIK